MTNTKQHSNAVFTFTITAEQQRVIDTLHSPQISLRGAHQGKVSGDTGSIDVVDIIDDRAVLSYTIESDGTYTVEALDDFHNGWSTLTEDELNDYI